MERVNLIFLHGFLGRPKDWSPTVDFLMLENSKVEIYQVDLFNDEMLNPQVSLAQWGESFCKWMQKHVDRTSRNILVGYSLGGRLALHALEACPNLIERAFIVSANSGFPDNLAGFESDSQDRKSRWLHDANWAELFIKAPWAEVLKNWNAQPIFAGTKSEPPRPESEYSREALGLALTNWSLAQQKDLRPVVEKNLAKISWIVGENDTKYVDIARNLEKDIPQFHFEMIKGASHRVMFDEPRQLAAKIKSKI